MNTSRNSKIASHGRPVEADSLFDVKREIESSHTSELVIALCGPIGSPLHKVAEAITERLTNGFKYDRCITLRLSDIIREHKASDHEDQKTGASEGYRRIKTLIAQGDELRELHGASVLAELAVSQIAIDRQKERNPSSLGSILTIAGGVEDIELLQIPFRTNDWMHNSSLHLVRSLSSSAQMFLHKVLIFRQKML